MNESPNIELLAQFFEHQPVLIVTLPARGGKWIGMPSKVVPTITYNNNESRVETLRVTMEWKCFVTVRKPAPQNLESHPWIGTKGSLVRNDHLVFLNLALVEHSEHALTVSDGNKCTIEINSCPLVRGHALTVFDETSKPK